jgi:hypothetical protein
LGGTPKKTVKRQGADSDELKNLTAEFREHFETIRSAIYDYKILEGVAGEIRAESAIKSGEPAVDRDPVQQFRDFYKGMARIVKDACRVRGFDKGIYPASGANINAILRLAKRIITSDDKGELFLAGENMAYDYYTLSKMVKTILTGNYKPADTISGITEYAVELVLAGVEINTSSRKMGLMILRLRTPS